MRIENAVLLVLVVVVSLSVLVGCPSLWQYWKPPTVTVSEEAPPYDYQAAAQRILVWCVPGFIVGALGCVAASFYFKKSWLLVLAVICGVGLGITIGLLVFWKVVATTFLVLFFASVAVGLLLASLRLTKMLKRKDIVLKSVTDGIEAAKPILPGVGLGILQGALADAQKAAGTQADVDKFRGLDPAEREKEA